LFDEEAGDIDADFEMPQEIIPFFRDLNNRYSELLPEVKETEGPIRFPRKKLRDMCFQVLSFTRPSEERTAG
ncbi:MAG: hypothetical protein IJP92_14085, partial [Lachnospiraceae bacterium]|nr:hypothetical protein [Lachnospiraceae bacterium]